MDKENKSQQPAYVSDEEDVVSRREYLIGLKKWSKVVIGGVLLGCLLAHTDKEAEAGSWVNRRGGWADRGWANRRGGGGTWANRKGGWGNAVWIDR